MGKFGEGSQTVTGGSVGVPPRLFDLFAEMQVGEELGFAFSHWCFPSLGGVRTPCVGAVPVGCAGGGGSERWPFGAVEAVNRACPWWCSAFGDGSGGV